MRSSNFLNKDKKRRPRRIGVNSHAYRSAATAAFKQALEKKFGSQGAASSVRRIDPVTGETIEILEMPSKA